MSITKDIKKTSIMIGKASLYMPVLNIILIINWAFQIIPLNKLQGMPVLFPVFICPFGFAMGILSLILSSNKYGKWGVILNSTLFFVPFIYWYGGTLILGV